MVYFDKDGALLRSDTDPADELEVYSFASNRWIKYAHRAPAVLNDLIRLTKKEAAAVIEAQMSDDKPEPPETPETPEVPTKPKRVRILEYDAEGRVCRIEDKEEE